MRLRHAFAALCLLLALPAPPAHALTWRTVVYDSFNSGGVPSHWHLYNARYGSPLNDNCAAPSQVTVSGGYLHLKLSWKPTGKCGADWYSGGMGLDNSLSAHNQRITVRFRILSVNKIYGHRIIPMLSANDGSGNGEQDFCESEASTISNCMTFLHWSNHSGRTDHRNYYSLSRWHTMTFTRVGYHITSVIDGHKEFDYWGTEKTTPSNLKHVVLQQECPWYSCPAGRTGYEDIQIDYVKVENG
jgi:hypothetical protein